MVALVVVFIAGLGVALWIDIGHHASVPATLLWSLGYVVLSALVAAPLAALVKALVITVLIVREK